MYKSCPIHFINDENLWLQLHYWMLVKSSPRDEERRSLSSQLTGNLRYNLKQSWIRKRREMGRAVSIGNSRNLFQVIRNDGSQKTSVSQVIRESDGTLIYSQRCRLLLGQNTLESNLLDRRPQRTIHFCPQLNESKCVSTVYPNWRWWGRQDFLKSKRQLDQMDCCCSSSEMVANC